jgi:hypothetical protein
MNKSPGYAQLQQVLKTVSAAAAAARNVTQDIDDGSKDIAATVCQQSGCLNVIHIRNILMHLNETGSGLSGSDSNEAFLDDSAVIKLQKPN